MSRPIAPPGPFRIPAFRDSVPRRMQPWVYVVFAACFQLSGGMYLGALNEIIGSTGWMREDVLFCLYANLAGMATYFPLLFRMKFRFTNKTLLTAAATGVLATNLLIPLATVPPVAWALCFVEGVCKLQGTFECMSNIQTWMTPRRDFRVFFPVLHLFIMGAQHISGFYASAWGWLGDWRMVHWTIALLMLLILLVLRLATRHVRIFPKTPLLGIDWTGYVLWNALVLQVAAILDYGDWLAWYKSPLIWTLTGTACLTLGVIMLRMRGMLHPFISRKAFWFRHVVPILLLITAVEALLGTERILEEIYCEDVLGYGTLTAAWREGPALLGCWVGCGFAFWWLKVRQLGYTRLAIVGLTLLVAYQAQMYFLISPMVERAMLFSPVFCRAFAATVLAIVFMISLQDSMDFHTFFQGLSVFNMIHMVIGTCLGTAVYGEIFGRMVADGFARYSTWVNHSTIGRIATGEGGMPAFMEQMVERNLAIGVKYVYGVALWLSLFLLLAFLLYDAPARRRVRRMPTWREVGRRFMGPRRQRRAMPAEA